MYDSTNVGALPHGADAYAGYVEGLFPTFAALKRQFTASGAHLLSIAVFASGDAECLDIEPGDATNAQAPGWVKRQLARGAHRPCLYTSVGNMDALVTALGGAGISRAAVRLWSAHYGQGKHICGPATCGLTRHASDGTQWTDSALGRSLDESILLSDFFSPSAPAIQPIVEESMLLKTGAGALTPVAIPHGATHVRCSRRTPPPSGSTSTTTAPPPSTCRGSRAHNGWRCPRVFSPPSCSGWTRAPGTSRWSANNPRQRREGPSGLPGSYLAPA
jgi:hypothetical protein